jgi:hypothetical protein
MSSAKSVSCGVSRAAREAVIAVQVGFSVDGAAVDAQQSGAGAAQVATQPRLGLQRADQLAAAGR